MAHVFPPPQAQGPNQALEDAWLLRRALRASGASADALRCYEQIRAQRVRRISRLAAKEVTHQPPGRGSPAGCSAAALWPACNWGVIRRSSSVLNDDAI